MVRRESDGRGLTVCLYFTTADGELVKVFGGPDFTTALATMEAQVQMRMQNNTRRDEYMGALHNAQLNIDTIGTIGKAGTMPVKPKRIVVEDPIMKEDGTLVQGKEYEVEWTELPALRQ